MRTQAGPQEQEGSIRDIGRRMERLLVISAMWIGSMSAGWSQELYLIPELTDEDLLRIDLQDGSIGDWLDVLGEAEFAAGRQFVDAYGRPFDPADCDFRVWLAWHGGTNRLYGAMERTDDDYVNDFLRTGVNEFHRVFSLRGDMKMQDGSIRVAVDGDHSGGGAFFGWNVPLSSMERTDQYFSILPETFDDGPQIQLYLHQMPGWFVLPPYADGGGRRFGEQPVVTVTEFYMTPFDEFVWDDPVRSRVSQLSAGKVIGVQLSVSDRDGDAYNSITGVYSYEWVAVLPPDPTGNWADAHPDMLLLPASARGTAGGGGGLEGVSTSWARIKASFAMDGSGSFVRTRRGRVSDAESRFR